MKMRIFYLIVLLSINSLYAQDKDKYKNLINCEHLKIMLENDTAIKQFFLKRTNSKIIFIDQLFLFDCDSLIVNNQEVVFLHNYSPKFFNYFESLNLLIVKRDRYITISYFKEERGNYIVELWCLNNNSTVRYTIYPKKRKNNIKVIGYGVF